MNFRNCRLRNEWLEKYLKSPVSEEPLTSDMVSGPEH